MSNGLQAKACRSRGTQEAILAKGLSFAFKETWGIPCGIKRMVVRHQRQNAWKPATNPSPCAPPQTPSVAIMSDKDAPDTPGLARRRGGIGARSGFMTGRVMEHQVTSNQFISVVVFKQKQWHRLIGPGNS